MTMFTRSTSIPRPKISVATKIRFSKALKAVYRLILLKDRIKEISFSRKLYSPFFLLKTRVNTDTRKIARDKQFIQFDGPGDRFYEDNNLEDGDDVKKNNKCTYIVPG